MEGRKNKAYYNTGSYGTPVWTLLNRISGVKRAQSRNTSEYNYREAENIKTALGKKKYSFTFKYETKRAAGATDTVLAALQDSFDNETELDVAFVDQAIATTGAFGVRGPFVVADFARDESDESNTAYDVTLMEIDSEDSGSLVETVPWTTA